MAWYDDDPKVQAELKKKEKKDREKTRKATKQLDKAYADSKKSSGGEITGWITKGGRRIPIRNGKSC